MSNLQQLHEEWKDIPNYEGLYQVSSLGRVKSNDRLIYRSHCVKALLLKGRIMRYLYTTDGYQGVMLYKKGFKRVTFRMNDLVFFTFNPEIKKVKGFEIDHDDNDKTNNALYNLRYISGRANSTKRSLNLKKTSKYTGVSLCKRSNQWVSFIRINSKSKYLGRFATEEEAAQAYQTALNQIQNKAA